MFTCNPIQFAWDKKFGGSLDKPPVCIDTGLQNKFLSSMHVAQVSQFFLWCQCISNIDLSEYCSSSRTNHHPVVRQDQHGQKGPSLLHMACRRHDSPRRTPPANNGHRNQRLMLAIHIRHALDSAGPDIRHTYRLTPCFGCSDNGDVELHQD